MVYLNRIYTRSGDGGTTSLGNGECVSKTDPHIAAIGAIDELNASIGVVIAHATSQPCVDWLQGIQNTLFDLGADICVPFLDTDSENPPLRVTAAQVECLEKWIDTINDTLSPLTSFILPGGTVAASYLHMSRTVCRRAELELVRASKACSINSFATVYLNRLSDLLFVMARDANDQGKADILWKPGE